MEDLQVSGNKKNTTAALIPEYFECQCSSSEHILRFIYDPDENELYCEIQLIQYRNVLKRIWIAIKYIFKYQSRYGCWDCWMMKNEDCERLTKLLDQITKNTQSGGS